MINIKLDTNLPTNCNDKEAWRMQKAFHCKYRFGIMIILAIIHGFLDLYLIVDQRQMKVIDVDYSVRVGY
jgi:hypothetical protein